jgi:tRNA pseudouridine55 synthase
MNDSQSKQPNIPSQPEILLIDKPTGMTSHDVVNIIRRKTGVKRVGHAGTLDPLATGLLIILVGRESTKRQSEFLKQDKEYEVVAQLGIETDTYDSDGKITHESSPESVAKITQEDVEHVLTNFRGKIDQTVPAYSAVKMQGQKLYEIAREGKADEIVLPIRSVEIYSLELADFQKDTHSQKTFFKLKVHCSSGTYVRSLVYDIGRKLGVGATVTQLRRTKIGDLTVENADKLTR